MLRAQPALPDGLPCRFPTCLASPQFQFCFSGWMLVDTHTKKKVSISYNPTIQRSPWTTFGYSLPVFSSPFLSTDINTLNKVMNPLHVLLLLTLLCILNHFPESMYFSSPGLLLAQRQVNHCSPLTGHLHCFCVYILKANTALPPASTVLLGERAFFPVNTVCPWPIPGPD